MSREANQCQLSEKLRQEIYLDKYICFRKVILFRNRGVYKLKRQRSNSSRKNGDQDIKCPSANKQEDSQINVKIFNCALIERIEKEKVNLKCRKTLSRIEMKTIRCTNVRNERLRNNAKNHSEKSPLLIIEGHRGVGMFESHNSMSSFSRAIRMHLDYVELDTWLASDGEVVVVHGTDGKIKCNDEQMRGIEELSSEQTTQIVLNEKNDCIPTLGQVFKLCKGKIKINIELKGENHNLAEAVVRLIQLYDMTKEVYISSFFHPFKKDIMIAMQKFDMLEPIKFGYLFSKKLQFPELDEISSSDQLNFSSVLAYDPETIEFIGKARKKGISLCCYFGYDILENELIYIRLIQMGITTIITNQPNTLLNFRRKYFQ